MTQLIVSANDTVTLTYGNQSLDLSVEFNDIQISVTQAGPISTTESITIENKEVMFGTWLGYIDYTVSLTSIVPDCSENNHLDENDDGKCDSCDKNLLEIPNIGNVTVNNPDVSLEFNSTSNELMATLPSSKNPQSNNNIDFNVSDEIEFNYGVFESNAIYNPEEYTTVEYKETRTKIKTDTMYLPMTVARFGVSVDENGQVLDFNFISAGEILLKDLSRQNSDYIFYTIEDSHPVEVNGISAPSLTWFDSLVPEDDTLENVIYLAASYNYLRNTDSYHVAHWNGEYYETLDVSEEMSNVIVETETYVVTTTKRVLTQGPSYSTEYVYVPQGVLRAKAGMTWSDWLVSSYNTKITDCNIIIRDSNYQIINASDEIVAGESYSFYDAPPVEYNDILPGLYRTGSNYTDMIMDWATLINDGVFSIDDDGYLWHECDQLIDLRGDLVLSKDAGIITIRSFFATGFAYDHPYITGVIIPEGVKNIETGTMWKAVNLSHVVLPDSLETIGMTAFSQSGIESIVLPPSLTMLGGSAFADCKNLKSAILSESLTELESSVFANTALESINIPAGITRIAPNAFANCSNLKAITFDGNQKWYYTELEDYTGGTEIDLSDPATAAQYFASDLSEYYFYNEDDDGGAEEDPCVTPDSLVTLADGSQKRIDEVKPDDMIIVWDSYNGIFTSASLVDVFAHGLSMNTVIELVFSDNTIVKVVNIHQFLDMDLCKYVSITKDTVENYVGHEFMKYVDGEYIGVTLVDYSIRTEEVEAWGIISSTHYNVLVENMVTANYPESAYYLFNYFDMNEEFMYDAEQVQNALDTYGVYTYDEFAEYIDEEKFNRLNIPYMKVAVGKGYLTYDDIVYLIKKYL